MEYNRERCLPSVQGAYCSTNSENLGVGPRDVESTLWLGWQFLGEPEHVADIHDDWTLDYL
jgi:hypothetical protein